MHLLLHYLALPEGDAREAKLVLDQGRARHGGDVFPKRVLGVTERGAVLGIDPRRPRHPAGARQLGMEDGDDPA